MLRGQEHGALLNNARQDYVQLIAQVVVFSEDYYLGTAVGRRKKLPVASLQKTHRFSARFAIADLVHP